MKIFSAAPGAQCHLYSEPVPMSYGFPMLTDLVKTKVKKDPQSGDFFIFRNKKSKYIKIIYFYADTPRIWMTKTEEGAFDVGSLEGERVLSIAQMESLINRVVSDEGRKKLPHLKSIAKGAEPATNGGKYRKAA